MAERSKALVLGTSSKERGFESHSCQLFTLLCNASNFFSGVLHKLPIISYQGEDALNVYRSPVDIISSILEKYDEVRCSMLHTLYFPRFRFSCWWRAMIFKILSWLGSRLLTYLYWSFLYIEGNILVIELFHMHCILKRYVSCLSFKSSPQLVIEQENSLYQDIVSC